jgi:hypothetical protein
MVSGCAREEQLDDARATIRRTRLGLRRLWRRANSSRWACKCGRSCQPIRRNARVGRNLAVGETLEHGLIVGLGVGEAHAAVGLRPHQHQLVVWPPSPRPAPPSIRTRGPSRAPLQPHQRRPQPVQPRRIPKPTSVSRELVDTGSPTRLSPLGPASNVKYVKSRISESASANESRQDRACQSL